MYDEHIVLINKAKTFTVGDDVIVLIDYSLCLGKVVKVNPKGIKVLVAASGGCIQYLGNFKYEKVCKVDTKAVLVWERWKGKNGRGGYRLDTIMYPELAQAVSNIRGMTYLYEDTFGVVTEQQQKDYADRFKWLVL